MNIKFLNLTILFVMILSSSALFACPMCGGAGEVEKDQYTTFVLAGFILMTYIPYLVIFRLIKKFHRPKESPHS